MSIEELIAIIRDRFEYRDGGFWNRYMYAYRIKAGNRAGSYDSEGYRQIVICGKTYFEHRLVFLLHNNRWPSGEIDHINRIRDDNRIENLRDVSGSENQQNKSQARRTNRLGIMGVRKSGASKFTSQIKIKDKIVHLGTFSTAEEASLAYWAAKKLHHSVLI